MCSQLHLEKEWGTVKNSCLCELFLPISEFILFYHKQTSSDSLQEYVVTKNCLMIC